MLEVLANILDDVLLGGGRQAKNRRRVLSVVLCDVARDVAVVRAEVVPPFRKAVRLVNDPCPDSASRDRRSEGTVAELLGGDEHDAGVAKTDLGERLRSLRHGDETIDGGGACYSLASHGGDLIGHQRHQGRDHHGESRSRLVAHQRRELVAKRLAGPGGKDAEHMVTSEVLLDYGALKTLSVPVLGPIPEGGEPEPALGAPLRRRDAQSTTGSAGLRSAHRGAWLRVRSV